MIEVSLGQIVKAAMQCHAGIVDKDVYGTDLPFYLCPHCLNRCGVGHVGLPRKCPRRVFAVRLRAPFRRLAAWPVIDGNVGPGPGGVERNGPADTTRRSCDEGAAIA